MECIKAGIKSWEIDDLTMAECRLQIWGNDKIEMDALRKIASINYTILAVNRDPKKSFPTINKMYPELWKDVDDIENDPLIKAARLRRKQNN